MGDFHGGHISCLSYLFLSCIGLRACNVVLDAHYCEVTVGGYMRDEQQLLCPTTTSSFLPIHRATATGTISPANFGRRDASSVCDGWVSWWRGGGGFGVLTLGVVSCRVCLRPRGYVQNRPRVCLESARVCPTRGCLPTHEGVLNQPTGTLSTSTLQNIARTPAHAQRARQRNNKPQSSYTRWEPTFTANVVHGAAQCSDAARSA